MAWSSSLKSLFTVFAFTILAVSSQNSYKCTVENCDQDPCPSEITPSICDTTKGCYRQIQKFETQTPATNIFLRDKGCIKDTCNALEFSATLGDQHTFSYKSDCCTADQCNKDNINLSLQSSQPNGVECPACYTETGQCTTTTILKCKGAEKKCVDVTGTAEGPVILQLHGKGCGTENACSLDMTLLNGIKIKSTCTSGSPALKSISSVPIVLLLLKVLL